MTGLAPVARIKAVLRDNTIVAVVGLSPKPSRPSHQVAAYLQQAGYRIIPVNPGRREILGQPCYPDLRAIPGRVEVVDIFRRPELVEPVVRDAIAIHARVVWMQEGIVNEQAAALAEKAGLTVIMDRCMKMDHLNFIS